MGQGARVTAALDRRAFLGAGAAACVAACDGPSPAGWTAAWVGTSPQRGHRLRDPRAVLPTAAGAPRKTRVLVIGAGIAGLSAARAFMRQGLDDLRVLELEDTAGGNSRAHAIAGMACPIGAHYLPVPGPGPAAREVSEWLHEIGLMRHELGRSIPDERHLCHSPQERLFVDGGWVDGLLPPARPGSATLAQYRALAALVARHQRHTGFAMPSHRAGWTAAHQALDAVSFGTWLNGSGLVDERLRWYLDYCCRDDYGGPADTVSAWAGLHYFASRRGFHAPGDADTEREPVFTWPEGNGWLTRRLAGPLGDRLLPGRTVLQVVEGRHGVQVLAWDEVRQQAEAWQADTVVMAVPLFVAARLLRLAPSALVEIVPRQPHAPWLVANLHIAEPLLQRLGAPPSWDNVVYGRSELGYVDAMHQSTRPEPGPTVLTCYQALNVTDRPALLDGQAEAWAARVVDGLRELHPDLPAKLRHVALTRHGHAMSIPVPGLRGHPALAALRAQRGRVRFAHADLAGYSVFEEAFTLGAEVASRV